jgi:hypothetical protein
MRIFAAIIFVLWTAGAHAQMRKPGPSYTINAKLFADIKKVCPGADGLNINDPAVKASWTIHFADGTAPECKAAAQAVLDAFTPPK